MVNPPVFPVHSLSVNNGFGLVYGIWAREPGWGWQRQTLAHLCTFLPDGRPLIIFTKQAEAGLP